MKLPIISTRHLPISGILCLLFLGLSACSTTNKQDPLEPLNRGIFAVNKKLDKFMVKPLAIAYDKSVPPPLKRGLIHFFDNIWTIPTIANDLLQFEFKQAGVASMRFLINSTIGIGGLFDVASKWTQLPPHKQDFGHTLERWGYHNSAYLVLPIFGPSTIRDGVGRVATVYMTPYPYIHSVPTRNWLMGINFFSDRADLLKVETIIETAAVDEYVFMRDAYLQKRESDMAKGTFTIGKESGVSETFSGGDATTASKGRGALEQLQGPPE
ncbi:MAG: putative phospholipid-binding lipoprotein MlaA [Pseudomonadota bacterium]